MAKFLDVFAVTTNGQIKHTFRKENNGNWQSFFGDIEQTINREVAHFVEVAVRKKSASDIDGICLVDQAGKCYYASKRVTKTLNTNNRALALVSYVLQTGKKVDVWDILTTTSQAFPAVSVKRMISTEHDAFLLYNNASGKGVIEVCSIAGISKMSPTATPPRIYFPAQLPSLIDFDASANDGGNYFFTTVGVDGNIYIVERQASGLILNSIPKLALPNGEKCVRVSCCISAGDLHITAVSQQGNIYHGIYIKQNNFGDIQGVTGRAGSFTDISCADIDGVLHVVGTTNDGRVLHTFRRKNGSWQTFFGDIETKTGEAGHFVSVSISAREE